MVLKLINDLVFVDPIRATHKSYDADHTETNCTYSCWNGWTFKLFELKFLRTQDVGIVTVFVSRLFRSTTAMTDRSAYVCVMMISIGMRVFYFHLKHRQFLQIYWPKHLLINLFYASAERKNKRPFWHRLNFEFGDRPIHRKSLEMFDQNFQKNFFKKLYFAICCLNAKSVFMSFTHFVWLRAVASNIKIDYWENFHYIEIDVKSCNWHRHALQSA